MVLSALALFAVSLGYGVVVPLVPTLAGGAEGLGLSLVYALYSAAKISAQLPGGVWVDRVGADRMLRLGLGLFVLATAGFLIPGPVWWLVALRIVEGLATGLVYPAVFARVFSAGGSGTSLGAVGGLGSSGMVLGPALAGLLGRHDVRTPLAIAVLVALLAFAWSFLERKRGAERPRPPRTLKEELGQLAALGRNVAFVGTLLPIAFNKLSFTGLAGVLPLHAKRFVGLELGGVTVLFGLLGVTFGLAQPLGGALADRFAARKVVLLAAPLSLASLAAMSFLLEPVPHALALVGYVAGSSVVFAVVLKHAADAHGSAGTHGGVFGVIGTSTDVMTVLGPLVFVNAYQAWPRALYALMASVGVVFFVGFWALGRRDLRQGATN